MVIIKINAHLPKLTANNIVACLHEQAEHGVIVLPNCCDLLYASDGPAGQVYTIRKDGVICDTSNLAGCGYTDTELQQLHEAGFDLYYGEQKAERASQCTGPACLRWRECQGTGVETCPM